MAWAVPQYSKNAVNRAAALIANPTTDLEPWLDALGVVNNWRASHSFPLNTFQTTLRKIGRRADPNCTVAQRIKRLPSIIHKIERFPTMTISQMQDIGGCRCILRDVDAVREVVEAYRKSNIKHRLHHADDYISNPKASGYRGVHLVYRYHSDKKKTYNSLLIELQIRSQLQHAWATAVETVGTFVGQALKSSLGQAEWLRFFALAGWAIAVIERGEVFDFNDNQVYADLEEFRDLVVNLDVLGRMSHYRSALNIIGGDQSRVNHYFVVELEASASNVRITGFPLSDSSEANDYYSELEKRRQSDPSYDVVLVSAESVEALKRAYPNYFADTAVFEDVVGRIAESPPIKA